MSYLIVNTATSRIVARFPTERGAKISLARKFAGKVNPDLQVMEESVYDIGFRKKVAVQSLMSGGTVMLDVNDAGTCVDPSTERYWSQ